MDPLRSYRPDFNPAFLCEDQDYIESSIRAFLKSPDWSLTSWEPVESRGLFGATAFPRADSRLQALSDIAPLPSVAILWPKERIS